MNHYPIYIAIYSHPNMTEAGRADWASLYAEHTCARDSWVLAVIEGHLSAGDVARAISADAAPLCYDLRAAQPGRWQRVCTWAQGWRRKQGDL